MYVVISSGVGELQIINRLLASYELVSPITVR